MSKELTPTIEGSSDSESHSESAQVSDRGEGQTDANIEDHDDAYGPMFESSDDWYADSLEQYETKILMLDPYEIEGMSRENNFFLKLLIGILVFVAVLAGTLVLYADEDRPHVRKRRATIVKNTDREEASSKTSAGEHRRDVL